MDPLKYFGITDTDFWTSRPPRYIPEEPWRAPEQDPAALLKIPATATAHTVTAGTQTPSLTAGATALALGFMPHIPSAAISALAKARVSMVAVSPWVQLAWQGVKAAPVASLATAGFLYLLRKRMRSAEQPKTDTTTGVNQTTTVHPTTITLHIHLTPPSAGTAPPTVQVTTQGPSEVGK